MPAIPSPNSTPERAAFDRWLIEQIQSHERTTKRNATNTEAASQKASSTTAQAISINNSLQGTQAELVDKGRAPAAPDGLIASSAGGWDALGNPSATVTLTWDAVTSSPDSAGPIKVSSYEIWSKDGAGSAVIADYKRLSAATSTSLATRVEVGKTYSFIVRAITAFGVLGAFSDFADVTTTAATVAIPAPTKPVVSQTVGVVSVVWDGQFTVGGTPSYFRNVNVLQSTSATGTYTLTGQTLSGPGGVAISGLAADQQYFYKLQAVDSAGAVTGLSAASDAITPEGVDLSGINDQIAEINDKLAAPIDDSRFTEGSLTVWPFQAGTIPAGSFGAGAVRGGDIADFAITARKFNDNRHHIF